MNLKNFKSRMLAYLIVLMSATLFILPSCKPKENTKQHQSKNVLQDYVETPLDRASAVKDSASDRAEKINQALDE